MKAVVFHGVGDIRLDAVADARIEKPSDAVVRLTASAICGTDLHLVRGTLPGMKPGRILGHEGVGVVEETGPQVRNFKKGDRVVVGSTIGCGYCSYCRAGFYSQCDNANPNGPETAFYGGPESGGGFNGMQAELVRVPFAATNLVRVPEEVADEEAILISDIFPTGYQAAEQADICPGRTVAVFGCGPVGQFAIASAMLLNAGRVFAIDTLASRLEMARAQGAEVIDYNREDPVAALRELTGGIGVDRVIDAVGVDANAPSRGPAKKQAAEFEGETAEVAPKSKPRGDNWHPGNAPSIVLHWAVESLAKAGTLSIVGVYSEAVKNVPIGTAMNKNLRLHMGNCNHRAYIPKLLELVRTGAIRPSRVLTQTEPLTHAIDAYKHFDKRESGWIKVMLDPGRAPAQAA